LIRHPAKGGFAPNCGRSVRYSEHFSSPLAEPIRRARTFRPLSAFCGPIRFATSPRWSSHRRCAALDLPRLIIARRSGNWPAAQPAGLSRYCRTGIDSRAAPIIPPTRLVFQDFGRLADATALFVWRFVRHSAATPARRSARNINDLLPDAEVFREAIPGSRGDTA
jgi:hypothetical protein